MRHEPQYKVGKAMIAGIIFAVLKGGIKSCSRLDSKVKKMLDAFPEGYVITLRILPYKPCMSVKKLNGKIVNAKRDDIPDLEIAFKNIEVALPYLLGKRSIRDAYCYSSIVTRGSIGDTVSLVECLNIVENYLFPNFITSKILDDNYKKEVSSLRVYLGVLLGV